MERLPTLTKVLKAINSPLKVDYPSFRASTNIIMKVKILLFGQLTDITGADTITLEGVVDTDSLAASLHGNYPGLINAKYVIAVDKKVISENTLLVNNSTVALLPPFSGG